MPQRRHHEPLRWISRTIPPPGNVRALRRAIAARPDAVILESAACHATWGRWSIFATDALRVFTLPIGTSTDPLAVLARECRPWSTIEPPTALPFIGGWIGYLAYEAGRFVEPTGWFLTADNAAGHRGRHSNWLPIAQWALFDTVLIHDAFNDTWTVAGIELPPRLPQCARPALAERLAALEQFVEEAGAAGKLGEQPSYCHAQAAESAWNFSHEAYLKKVERALEYIRAGDIFQVNLARQCRVATPSHPFHIYECLCDVNPSTYAAYLPISFQSRMRRPSAVVSSSPELFLRVHRGEVTTRPIKGTRPRGCNQQEDRIAREELADSEKDRAELNMIIDLERNDLGRVCEFGTVRVISDGEIETLPTVFHRTATIVGRLRPDADAIDLLRAAFPGGSITGAPKVRAVQIINELEPTPRGPYCGGIGCIGLDGDMTLNLAIRTMVMADGRASLTVGSGIVADSDPEAEYNELEAKAAGMLAALGALKEAPWAVAEGR